MESSQLEEGSPPFPDRARERVGGGVAGIGIIYESRVVMQAIHVEFCVILPFFRVCCFGWCPGRIPATRSAQLLIRNLHNLYLESLSGFITVWVG